METNRGADTYQEILSQGETWAKTLAAAGRQTAPILEWLRKPRSDTYFIGCGSTYYLSQAAAFHWRVATGGRAIALPSSELWLNPSAYLPGESSLLVCVSRSAETSETVHALETYQKMERGDSLVVTCYGDRQLAQMADQKLVAQDAQERSVAQTRSFTSMFLLTQAAAGVAAEDRDYLSDLEAVPAAFGPLIENYESLARQLAEDARLERFIFLGSGLTYGLANEAMLKMKEMSLSPSEAFHFLEFRHGPKSVVDEQTLIVGLLNEHALQQEAAVLSEMQELGATILAISEDETGLDFEHLVELRSGVGELARGVLTLPILQLLAYYRSMHKGLNPDQPKNLDAVVKL